MITLYIKNYRDTDVRELDTIIRVAARIVTPSSELAKDLNRLGIYMEGVKAGRGMNNDE